jgi:hypothetical protein
VVQQEEVGHDKEAVEQAVMLEEVVATQAQEDNKRFVMK